ncbi:uncharacterized protein BROUX77_004048 [Berkeleyomyces rouxiae]|uniref:uncharacterized protein n=1 Tax=Berkeleyomyces rouxiae TaxID=2035830 RepID=UPI003B7F105A
MQPSTTAPLFKPKDIFATLSAHFPHEQGFVFVYDTDVSPIVSTQGVLYVLQGTSRQRYSLRIPTHLSHHSKDDIVRAVQHQVGLLRRLADSGFSWSPRLMAESTEFDNPLGSPYMVVGWIEGRPLRWNDTSPSDRRLRNKVLWQMADIILELAMCTQETRCGHTASSYTTELIDREVMCVSRGEYPDITRTLRDCFIQRALVHRAFQGVPEISSFSLSHESLSAENILVDDNYNIVGIVGWGFSRPLPIQYTLRFPQFLAVDYDPNTVSPEVSDLKNEAFLSLSATLAADRVFFLTSVLTNVESQSPNSDIRRCISFAFADPHATWRHLIVESTLRPQVQSWMARRGWLLDVTQDVRPTTEDLIREVDGFKEFVERSPDASKGPDRKALLKAIEA